MDEYVLFAYCVIDKYGEVVGTHSDYEQSEMDKAFLEEEGVRGIRVIELFKKRD